MGYYICNCYNRDSVCNSRVESMRVSRIESILPTIGHLVGTHYLFREKTKKVGIAGSPAGKCGTAEHVQQPMLP